MASTSTASGRKPLRLWPGIIIAIVVVALRFVVPAFVPGTAATGLLAAMAGFALILLWWLLFSRAPWIERIGALVAIALGILLTRLIVHESIAGGMMGLMILVLAVPATVGPAFVAWAVATRHLNDRVRRTTMVATILLACGVWALLRTDGVKGEAGAELAWRWTPTAEERLLAEEGAVPTVIAKAPPLSPAPAAQPAPSAPAPATTEAPAKTAAAPAAVGPTAAAPPKPEWPGFRGPERDSVIREIRIGTDWTTSPPVELWRRPIGPGWSSFAVLGDYIYTQEQRGEYESVSAYRLSDGDVIWRHSDEARFYESNGGPGPRGTPTLDRGRVYTLGATGVVNALDARTGKRIWTRNAEKDTGAPRPGWGFAGSPQVVGDSLVVAASGRLIAYELATGKPRWTRTTGGGGYSSPHVATLHGVQQVLLSSGGGITSVNPSDGSVLWDLKGSDAVGIVQPWVLPDGDVLIAPGDMMGGMGIRRIGVSRQAESWVAQERWATRGLKPYFNDFVVHNGHAYGFDGTILSCISIEDGERRWKNGRYGAGQMVLLEAQDLLLVLSEEGELALVAADPEKYTEVARFKAIEGKTWNHPVVVGDVVLVRNGEEMAAFRLPVTR